MGATTLFYKLVWRVKGEEIFLNVPSRVPKQNAASALGTS